MIKKILVCKAGGNASQGAKIYRLPLTVDMLEALGVDEYEREVEVQIEGDALIVRKAEARQ